MCAVDGVLRVVGYEHTPDAAEARRATEVTSITAPVLEPTAA
jgi:hypothetical protein